MRKAKYVFFIVLCFLFLFTGCPSSPEMENKEPIEMNENEKKAVADYIEAFAYGDQGEFLKNLSNSLGGSSNGLTAECTSSPDAMEISLVFNSYDYDGDDGNRLVSGEVTLSLSGKYEEGTTLKASSSNTLPYFEATSYTVSSDALTLTGGEQTVILKLEEVSGVFSDDAYGGVETPLVFEISVEKISISQTSISSTVFRNADSGNIAAEGRNPLPVSSFMQIVNENVPAKEMDQEMVSLIQGIIKTVFESIQTSYSGDFSFTGYTGTYSLSVGYGKTWTLQLNAKDDTENQLYFSVSSSAVEGNEGDFSAYFNERCYSTPYSSIFDGSITIPAIGYKKLEDSDVALLNGLLKEIFSTYASSISNGTFSYDGGECLFTYNCMDSFWDIHITQYEKDGVSYGNLSILSSEVGQNKYTTVNKSGDGFDEYYEVPVDELLADTGYPEFFNWDITARVAKDSLNNWEKVDSVSYDPSSNKITINARLGEMKEDTEGNKSIALLIGTGAGYGDILLNGNHVEKADLPAKDDSIAEDDEFIIYVKDAVTYTLSYKDPSTSMPLSISLNDTTSVTPPEPFDWDFSVRLAKEKGAENGNLDYVKPIELTGDIYAQHISIEAYVDAMKRSFHDGVEGKWIALLIGTGANDISRLTLSDGSYSINFSEEDKAERDGMVAYEDGSPAKMDEFVYYLNLEAEPEPGQSLYINLFKDDSDMVSMTFDIEKLEAVTIEEPNWTDVKSALNDFIKAFASVYSSTDFEESVTYLDSEGIEALSSWSYKDSMYYDFDKPLMPVNSVKMLNDKEFSADTTFEIYIGGNRVYKDLGWYIDDTTGSLMVNKAALYITFLFNDYFEINGERLSYGAKSYPELDVDDIWWSTNYDSNGNANYNTRTKRNDGSYDIEVATTDIPLLYQHENREEGDIMFSFVSIEENGSTSNIIIMRRGSSSGLAVYPDGYVKMTSSEPEGILIDVEDRVIREEGVVISSDAVVKGNFEPVLNVSSPYVQSNRYDIIKKYFTSLDFGSLIKAINEESVTSGNGGTLSAEEGIYGWYEFDQVTGLTVYLYADNWEYQNNGQSHTLTGYLRVDFTGYMGESGNTLTSIGWMIQNDQRSVIGTHDLSIDGSEHNLKTFRMRGNFSVPLDIGLTTNNSGELDWNKEINMGTNSFGYPSVSTFIDDKLMTSDMFQDMMK